MKSVTVVDDTLRRNAAQVVTPEVRANYLLEHRRVLPASTKYLLMKDRRGRQIQETVRVQHVFEGRYLEHAVRRAKRWMRGPRFRSGGAPHHIAMAMAAFSLAYPIDFKNALTHAAV